MAKAETEVGKKKRVFGDGLTPHGIFILAESYQEAGELVWAGVRPRSRLTLAPMRLLYLHALEGFMRAFLRIHGKKSADLRSYMHDFTRLLDDCTARGLHISAESAAFINKVATASEYSRVRYEIDFRDWDPQKSLDQLVNTVAELKANVRGAIEATWVV